MPGHESLLTMPLELIRPEDTRIGCGSAELGCPEGPHPGLDDGIFDPKKITEGGFDHSLHLQNFLIRTPLSGVSIPGKVISCSRKLEHKDPVFVWALSAGDY
jgi:hypothetical protein